MAIYKIRDLCTVIKGNTSIQKATPGEYPLVVTAEERQSSNEYQFDCKAVCVPLVSSTGHGHASIKRIHYQEGQFALGSILAAIIPNDVSVLIPKYLYVYLSTFKDTVLVPLMKGSANVSLTINSILTADIEVPTIEMQEQIIQLVENIKNNSVKITDRLEQQKTLVKQFRQSVFQEAVQGKLVPQDPKAEPASLLLEDIKTEKERLISEGKIKREKLLPEITGDEIPYDLPNGWQWVRLGNITRFLGGYAFKSDTYIEDSNNQVVRLGNVKNDCLILNANPVYIPDEIAEQSCDYEIKVNDILITMTGTRGKRDYFYTCKVCGDSIVDRRLYLNQRVGCLRSYPQVNIDLLTIFLKSYIILDSIFETETGTANQGNIGSTAIAQLLFPLPPREEQERIVTKVKQAMDLCEELEENIIQSQKDSGLLMQSILRNAFK